MNVFNIKYEYMYECIQYKKIYIYMNENLHKQ